MACLSVQPVSPGQYTVGTLEKQFVRKSSRQNIFKKLSKTSQVIGNELKSYKIVYRGRP